MPLTQPTIPRAASPQYERVAQWRCSWWHQIDQEWHRLRMILVGHRDAEEVRITASEVFSKASFAVVKPDEIIVRYISHITRKVKA